MSQRAYQRLTVIRHKDQKPRKSIVLIKRTGYANVWLNDQHIYWDYNASRNNPGHVDFGEMINEVWQRGQNKTGVIVRRG